MAYYYCKVTVFFVSIQIKHRLSHRLLHRLLHRLFKTSHDIFCTNGTNLTILLCTNGTNLTIFLCTNGTNLTIFASERHDSSLHERHELNDFRRRKTRFSIFDKIVLSACRHRIIRVIRAKNRVIGLPILCHSCKKNRAIGLPISCHSCVIIGIGMDFLIL